MKTLKGKISSGGYGVASRNLAPVMQLICDRMGFDKLWPGTLNVDLEEDYCVKSDSIITRQEYSTGEEILLQRCGIGGRRAVIMRPDTHQQGQYHGRKCLELMCTCHLTTALGLAVGNEVVVEVEGNTEWWNGLA